MADALRENLEALLAGLEDVDVIPVAELREALAAPADVPPLPEEWTDEGREVDPVCGESITYRRLSSTYERVDDVTVWGGAPDCGPSVTVRGIVPPDEVHAVLAHHLARHGGGT